jgi:hypothetical protein
MNEARGWILSEIPRVWPQMLKHKATTCPVFALGKILVWPGGSGAMEWCQTEKASPLEDVARHSEWLARRLRCQVGLATAYFLTGATPLAEPIISFVDMNTGQVTLQINYPWVPAQLVMEAYLRRLREFDPTIKRARPAPRRPRKR